LKLVGLGPDEVFHRYLTPKWAFVPTSGAGAAAEGGRFNRLGVDALYLARSAETALEELKQGASIVPPATLVAFKITAAEVVDFSAGFDAAVWATEWAAWDCAWKKIARIDKNVPPSWDLADAVITAGYRGILFPSTRHPGGINLVLYPQNLTTGDAIDVHDPDGRLPADQSSWRRSSAAPASP
jgi:RES domain-containing protein